jgi:hypothetical protein
MTRWVEAETRARRRTKKRVRAKMANKRRFDWNTYKQRLSDGEFKRRRMANEESSKGAKEPQKRRPRKKRNAERRRHKKSTRRPKVGCVTIHTSCRWRTPSSQQAE